MSPLRLLQGFGAGLTIASAMVLLWREFGAQKPAAMAVYGLTVYLASLLGPVVGGLLTAWLSWRALFLMNLPLGLTAAALGAWLLPRDRPAPAGPVRLDVVGLVLFLGSVAALSVVLDMGQYWGWLRSPFFVPWLAALVVLGAGFVLWGTLAAEPLINLRLFAVRNYALGIGIKAAFSINLYALLGLLSAYMIELRGYQWWQGALVLLPAFVTLSATTAASVSRVRYHRLRMGAGLALMALATWVMGAVDLYTDKRWLAALLGVWGAGAGLVVVPVMLTLFEGLTPAETLQAAGVYNITRMLPAFVVGATLVTVHTQRADAHFDRLRQRITHNRPLVSETRHHLAHHYAARGSSAGVQQKQAHATLGRWAHANAKAFAFQTVLRYLALVPALGVGLVWFVLHHRDAEDTEKTDKTGATH
jgi:DHA2 family multidrug resistance protein